MDEDLGGLLNLIKEPIYFYRILGKVRMLRRFGSLSS